jgi:hypothetical protein
MDTALDSLMKTDLSTNNIPQYNDLVTRAVSPSDVKPIKNMRASIFDMDLDDCDNSTTLNNTCEMPPKNQTQVDTKNCTKKNTAENIDNIISSNKTCTSLNDCDDKRLNVTTGIKNLLLESEKMKSFLVQYYIKRKQKKLQEIRALNIKNLRKQKETEKRNLPKPPIFSNNDFVK